MTSEAPSDDEARARALSATLRAVRRWRGLRTSDVASALEMPQRSYEHFEAGRGRIGYDRILRFADATDSDAIAILAAAALGSPEFALRCGDNKLMLILMLAIRDFNEELADEIADLEPALLISAFTKLFEDLATLVRKRDALAEAWLGERQERPRRSGLLSNWLRKLA